MLNAFESATKKRIDKLIQQGLQAIYVLVGDEPLAQREHLDAIRVAAKSQGYEERTSLIAERNFNWQ